MPIITRGVPYNSNYYRNSWKKFSCCYPAQQLRLCCGETVDSKLKRAIFCVVYSSWLLHLRCWRFYFFERPFFNLNFYWCLSLAEICIPCCLLSPFSTFFLTLVFAFHSNILRQVQNLKSIFPIYVRHRKAEEFSGVRIQWWACSACPCCTSSLEKCGLYSSLAFLRGKTLLQLHVAEGDPSKTTDTATRLPLLWKTDLKEKDFMLAVFQYCMGR